MLQRLFTLLSLAAFTLFIGTIALWVWSDRHDWLVTYDTVEPRPGVWRISQWALSTEPSNLCIEHNIREQVSSVMGFGPEGQMFELTAARPDAGLKWSVLDRGSPPPGQNSPESFLRFR